MVISKTSQYSKCLSVKKKIRVLSILKLSLPINQQYIKIDLKNFQEQNSDEWTEEPKLDVF